MTMVKVWFKTTRKELIARVIEHVEASYDSFCGSTILERFDSEVGSLDGFIANVEVYISDAAAVVEDLNHIDWVKPLFVW